MKRRGILFLIIFVLFSVGALFGDEADGILRPAQASAPARMSISKVKVFLDEEDLTPDSPANGKIKYSTILSYTKFRENKMFTQKGFEKEAETTRLRLMNSGLFYSAQVETRESRKNPGSMVVYITVRTGFLLRFGSGNAYGLFGKAALGGRRNLLTGYLGYNKSGVNYVDENAFGLPLILGAGAFTNLPQSFVQKEPLAFDTSFKAGIFATPDISLGADVQALISTQDGTSADFTLSPFFCHIALFSEALKMKTEIRQFNFFGREERGSSLEAAINIECIPIKQITLAGLLGGGLVICDTKINLTDQKIRSGYTAQDLTSDCYGLFSAEFRWNALSFNMPPCFPVDIIPYIFTDLALAQEYSDKSIRLLDAYGVGLAINFDCPVFAYFNFSYGINHQGKGKFVFAAMQNF